MTRLCAVPLVLLACALATPGLRAQTPDSLVTLDAFVTTALERSSTLEAARAGAGALRQRALQAGAFPDPTVTVTGFPAPMMMGHGEQVAEFEVMQMLPVPGMRAGERQAATLAAEAEALRAEADAYDLRLAVAEAYLSLLRIERLESLLDTFLIRLESFADAAASRYAVGQAQQSDVLMLHLERDRLQAERLLLRAERAEHLAALSRLTRQPLLPHTRFAPAPLPDTTQLFSTLPERLERQALDRQIEQAEVERDLARRAFFPELGVGLMYGLVTGGTPSEPAADVVGVMASVRLPLQRGRLRARVEEAQLRQAEVRARREAFDASTEAEITALRALARQEAAALALYRDRLMPETDLTLASARAAYLSGQIPYTALLDAERTTYAVKQAQASAETRFHTALARLARALGILDLNDTDRSSR